MNTNLKRSYEKPPYAKKTKDNDWCSRCGGGGEWLERKDKRPEYPLEFRLCPVCKGGGVVPKQQRS